MFGENEAFSTHFWGPNTLICILPPSVYPGLVPVTVKDSRASLEQSPANGRPSENGETSKELFSSPSQTDLDFADSMLDTDLVMFNYREG